MRHLELADLKGKKIILLFDYDGTLTPIQKKPEDAILPDEGRGVLNRLSHTYDIGILSGRSLDDVTTLIGIPGIWYAGNHGFEIAHGNERWTEPRAAKFRPEMRRVAKKLGKLRSIQGIIIEDKGLTLSVHYRCVPAEDVYRVKAAFWEVIDREKVRITEGKKVLEVRPPFDWDKGKAVEWILERMGWTGGERIVYMGDDRTDEDAFRTVNKLNGISVLISEVFEVSEVTEVTEKPLDTYATHFLKDPEEVWAVLDSLV